MKDQSGTDQKLIEEISVIKQRIRELEQSESERKHAEQEIALLAEIGRVVGSTLDINQVYERVATEVRRLIPYDRLLVNRKMTPDGQFIASYVSGVDNPRRRQGDLYPSQGSATGVVMSTRRGILIQPDDAEEIKDLYPNLYETFKTGMRSTMSVPLISMDEVIGSMNFRSEKLKAYTEQDLSLAEKIGMQVAGAIANAQMFNNLSKTEKSLRESEEKFRGIFESITDVFYRTDREGLLLVVSPSVEQLLGYTPNEVTGKKLSEFYLNPEERDQFLSVLRSMGEVNEYEALVRTKDGSVVWVSTNAQFYRDKQGNILGVQGISRNITERKRAEDALTRSEEKFRKAFYTSPDSVNINRIEDGMYISINPGFTRITGYTEEDIIGKTSIECNIWDNIEDRQRLVAGLRKDGEVTNLEAAFRTKGGDIRHGLMSAAVIDLNGVPHILSITRDVTDRKRVEEKLIYIMKAVDSASDAVGISDSLGHHFYQNKALSDLFGYATAEELEAAGGGRVVVKDPNVAKEMFDSIMSGKSWVGELEMVTKSGRVFHAFERADAIKNSEGTLIGLIGIITDITKRKKTEEQLQQTLDSLRKAVGVTVQVMVSAVETRDPYTSGHQNRSAALARSIANEMGLPWEKIDAIRMAGSIHDIGKLSIPAEILSKPTKLSDIEFSLIKEHARKGYEMLKDVESPWPLAEIVYQHHERIDGSGYPRNLKGDDILIEARILAVADVVEAMASHRPYRPGLGIDAALNEIEKNRGIFYDEAVADACLRLFREKGFKLDGIEYK